MQLQIRQLCKKNLLRLRLFTQVLFKTIPQEKLGINIFLRLLLQIMDIMTVRALVACTQMQPMFHPHIHRDYIPQAKYFYIQ